MSQIIPGLFIGSMADARNLNALKRNRVTHILCAAGELQPFYPSEFTYFSIRLSDSPDFQIQKHFASAINFIS